MNKDHFKLLIDAINQDGKLHFNMSSFIGKLALDSDDYNKYIVNGEKEASCYTTNMLHSITTNTIFNCDSVGCIAGFAVALANDWQTPEWLKEENSDYHYKASFEEEANKFLGLTKWQGQKIYFNDEDCVWKYLAYYYSNEFPNLYLNLDNLDDYDDNSIWHECKSTVNFTSIDYKTAVKVLSLIMNEEIILGDDYGDISYISSVFGIEKCKV